MSNGDIESLFCKKLKNVEGLECGYYHYMPDKHAVEQVKLLDEEHLTKEIETVLCG